MTLPPGQYVGPYEIVVALGTGATGEVYKARDTRLGRMVAIKVLSPDSASDDEARTRLLHEARAAASLNHTHISAIYDVGEAAGRVYIAMELVDGQPLSSLLATGALTQAEVLRCGIQLADALAHAHSHGVVHRDLKSANVMLTQSRDIKVVDFGLARHVVASEVSDETTAAAASISTPGAIVGTLAYMSPEQLRGERADARSDVWALGVILFEMATSRRPFNGATAFALSAAVLNGSPTPLPPTVSAALQAVIGRCLEPEPARRYQHAGEVRAALEMVQPVLDTPPAPAPRRAKRIPTAALIVFGLAVGGGLTWLVSRATHARTDTTSAAAAPVIRIAVLPFENLTGDSEQDYFSDGLTEEMITQLGVLAPRRLRVIARASVMRYKGTRVPVNQIGRELGVDYLLGGSARRDAGRVRVTAQLIQARDQVQQWSEAYDRDIADILALQNDVARHVARALAVQLLPADAHRTSVNPEAYDLYLQGRAQLATGPAGLDRAQQLFERALKKNPNDALSYAGMSEVWQTRGLVQAILGKDATPRAKAAALKAVDLDATLADSHVALAMSYGAADWPHAEAEYKRALELNPNHAIAHGQYGSILAITNRYTDAVEHADWAAALDPFNPIVTLQRGFTQLAMGRADEVVHTMQSGLAAAPGIYQFHWMLWRAFHILRNDKDAVTELIALNKASGGVPIFQVLEQGYAAGGYREAMRRAAALREARAATAPPMDAAFVALLHDDAGNRERALDWLDQAKKDGDLNLPGIGVLAPDLMSDPRFQGLMQQFGLPR